MAHTILFHLNKVKGILIAVIDRFNEDRCFRVASALSFTTILSLVPLFTVIISMLSIFPVFERWAGEIEAFLFENFVPAAGDVIIGYLQEFSGKAGKLTAAGLVFLMLSSLFLLATIEDAFNDIWRIKQGRKIFQRLMVYWAVITLGPILISISLSMSSTFLSMSLFSEQAIVASITTQFLKFMPILFELAAFMLFYKAIPNTEIKVRHAFYGGVVATVLFELAKIGFAYYIFNFRSYELIYGAIAIFPIFLVWIYLSWIVLLLGALITAVLGEEEK